MAARISPAVALLSDVDDVRRRLRDLKRPPLANGDRAGLRNGLRHDLLVLHGTLTRAKNISKKNKAAMLREVKTMLATLDSRPGALERRDHEREQRLLADRRRTLAGLQLAGPGSLPYERHDPGKKLDEHGRAKTTAPISDRDSVSVRTVAGGLSGLGKRG